MESFQQVQTWNSRISVRWEERFKAKSSKSSYVYNTHLPCSVIPEFPLILMREIWTHSSYLEVLSIIYIVASQPDIWSYLYSSSFGIFLLCQPGQLCIRMTVWSGIVWEWGWASKIAVICPLKPSACVQLQTTYL